MGYFPPLHPPTAQAVVTRSSYGNNLWDLLNDFLHIVIGYTQKLYEADFLPFRLSTCHCTNLLCKFLARHLLI